MNKKLNRLRSTRDKKRALAEKLVKDVETLDAQIAQLENEEIVKSVREYRMTPEELIEFLQDLLAVLEEDEIPTPTPTVTPTTAPTPVPVVQPEPEPEPDNSTAMLGMIVLLLAAGGCAAFWFIKQKGGKNQRQPIENEYDDLEDEEDDEIIDD